MDRFVRVVALAAVAVAVGAAALGLLLVIRGPIDAVTGLIAGAGVAYLPTVLVGSALVRAERRNAVGWIFLISGMTVPLSATFGAAVPVVAARGGVDPGLLQAAANVLRAVGIFPVIGFGLLLFPDGRLGSRRRRLLAVGCGLQLACLVVWATFDTETFSTTPGVVNPIGATGAAADLVSVLVLGLLLTGPVVAAASWALLRRAHRHDGPSRRGLTLAAYSGFSVAAAYVACIVVGFSGGPTHLLSILQTAATIIVGIAAWAGIVRYGLYDIRAVLRRSISYALLLAAVTAVYLLAAAALGTLLGEITSAAVATAVAVVAALPLREVLARWVRNRIYGLRDEPAVAFARLGERLVAVGSPEAVLPAAAQTVAEALRLPYVAIEVNGQRLATAGAPLPGAAERLELLYGGEAIGTLVLQRTDTREQHRDRALLATLTQQVAVAARSVALAEALRRSREALATSREEERRRLHRDLHDGLSPTLASLHQRVDAAHRLISTDPDRARLLLGDSRAQLITTISEVRELVDALRPALLDELGLVGAITLTIERLAPPPGPLVVDVRVDDLPVLPAAVEIALYRIAIEAVTNVVRHADATRCALTLTADNATVTLAVADDGHGISSSSRPKSGLRTVRERVDELGGAVIVESEGGTILTARIPYRPLSQARVEVRS